MKKVCIIGHFAKGQLLLNGQTVKTKIVAKEIINKFGNEQVSCIDTHGGIRTIIRVLIQIVGALKNHKNIVILPAENGLRVIAPFLVMCNYLFKRRLHYVVVGGWLPQFLQGKAVLSRMLQKFNFIYVETNSMKLVLQKCGFNNAVVVPNCKDLNILRSHELKIDYSEPYSLCTFSRVMKEKGIEEAVRSVQHINEKEGRTIFSLDIFGQVDDNQQEWFQTLKSTFPSYVRYCGVIEFARSTEVLKDYFALLFPTYYEGEGFAGTLIDAMAAGVPVIASDWKYNKEIIQDGKTGILIKDSLEKTLSEVIKHKAQWAVMKPLCIKAAESYLPSKALKSVLDNIT